MVGTVTIGFGVQQKHPELIILFVMLVIMSVILLMLVLSLFVCCCCAIATGLLKTPITEARPKEAAAPSTKAKGIIASKKGINKYWMPPSPP